MPSIPGNYLVFILSLNEKVNAGFCSHCFFPELSPNLSRLITMTDCACPSTAAATGRRGFFKQLLAIVIGAVAGLIPLGAGVAVWLDPLWRKSAGTGMIRVTTLDALPDDGLPHKFPILATR